MNDDNQPHLEPVGRRQGRYLVWNDGSPPTLLPEDLWDLTQPDPFPSPSGEGDTNPAHAVCRSEADQ